MSLTAVGGSAEKNTGSPTMVSAATPAEVDRGGGEIRNTGGANRVVRRSSPPATADAPSTEPDTERGRTLIVSATPPQILTVSSQ